MLIYDLNIRFGFGEIGINTYKGNIDIKTDIQESFDMNYTKPQQSITTSQPNIAEIDYTQCWTEIGNPSISTAIHLWHNEAKQQTLDHIANKSVEGDTLGAIENNVSIADIVENESFPEPPEINVDLVPKSPPKIAFILGTIKTDMHQGNVNVDISDKPVTIKYDRANVSIFMKENPYITIKAVDVGENIDINL